MFATTTTTTITTTSSSSEVTAVTTMIIIIVIRIKQNTCTRMETITTINAVTKTGRWKKMDEGIKQWQEWPQLTKHLKKTNASEY